MSKKIVVYVYGTLRPGRMENVVQVPGELFSLGAYPAAVVKAPDCGSYFIAERCEVDPSVLPSLDRYEGYREDRPESSLYLRKPYLDGWIYEYNHNERLSDRKQIVDWLEEQGTLSGTAAYMMHMENLEEVC